MANQTKFEVVRTGAIDSEQTSLTSSHGIERKAGLKPQALSWWQAGKCVGLLMDILAIACSCAFFAYALAVKMHETKPMDHPTVQSLVEWSILGPTIYPILFAAVIGRALKSIAFWKLEKGGSIGTLDRLLGSMTIVQTVLTQLQMRSLSLFGLLLIVIWSLSPLGGQSSLRIIGSAIQPSNATHLLQYVNTTSDILNEEYAGGDTAAQFVPVNVLFGAAMLGGSSGSLTGNDAWGNMKYPWLENLDPSSADSQGWHHLPQLNYTDNFTSLIGIPMDKIANTPDLTTSFNIETSYWKLSCPVFEDLGDGSNATGGYDAKSQAALAARIAKFENPSMSGFENTSALAAQNMYMYSSAIPLYNASLPSDSPANSRPRHITYLENNNYPAQWVGANCTIRTTYVELSTSCSNGTCAATGIRRSVQPHLPEVWTSLDTTAFGFEWFVSHFVDALPIGHSVTATPYQKYIIDPENPLNGSYDIPPVTVVSNATFALRLSQLLNTYWMAMLAPTAITKGLSNLDLAADAANIDGTTLSNTTLNETQDTMVLRCNILWFAILLVSSAVTAFIGFCGLVATLLRLGPDIGFNISSLVKDSPFVDQTSVSTTLGSTDRSLLMKDWYAKLGDVAAEDGVGYIAIGSGNVADLRRGRLYQ